MDEMTILRRVGPALEEGTPADLARQRRRLTHTALARTRHRRFGRLRGWPLLAVVSTVTTALLIVPATLLAGHSDDRPTGPAAQTPPGAERLVSQAAQVARSGPTPKRPGSRQFLFVESDGRGVGGAAAGTTIVSKRRRVWLSVNGARPGLLRNGEAAKGQSGWKLTGRWESIPLGAVRAYRDDLPADPDKLLKQLTDAPGDRPSRERAFDALAGLLSESSIPPRTMAALFVAGSRIPGVTVVPTGTDAVGRVGVVLSQVSHDWLETELFFEPRTFTYLGRRTSDARTGKLRENTAVVRTAFVNQLGQMP
jgi:hypothetical protein